MTSSNENIFRITGPLCGEFTGHWWNPTQRPVTRSFDGFFYLHLNKRLSKQSWGWWFETLSHSLWRHRNEMLFIIAVFWSESNNHLSQLLFANGIVKNTYTLYCNDRIKCLSVWYNLYNVFWYGDILFRIQWVNVVSASLHEDCFDYIDLVIPTCGTANWLWDCPNCSRQKRSFLSRSCLYLGKEDPTKTANNTTWWVFINLSFLQRT